VSQGVAEEGHIQTVRARSSQAAQAHTLVADKHPVAGRSSLADNDRSLAAPSLAAVGVLLQLQGKGRVVALDTDPEMAHRTNPMADREHEL
jgi:hypothetical protein